jgi:hypothetical protein
MPHPEYTVFERSLSSGTWGADSALFEALWRAGFLPSSRPAEGTPAPRLAVGRPASAA